MFSNDLFLCFCVVIMSGMDGMDSMDSDEELFLTQNSFSQEILQLNFSIDSLLDSIEGSGEPAPQNSCAEELKKLVPDESIKGGPKAVQRNICIVDDEELEKRKESRIPPNTRVNTSWAQFVLGLNGQTNETE